MKYRIHARCLLLLIAACLCTFPAQAQQVYQGTATVSAGINKVFLGSGDHSGLIGYGAVTKHFGQRAGLVMQAGYVRSVDRSFHPDDSDFRERHMVLGDLALQLDALQLTSSGTEHRFGVKLGLTARHRNEETEWFVYYPAAMKDVFAHGALDEVRNRGDRFYLFEVDGEPYGVGTYVDEGTEAGILVGFNYTLRFRRYMIGAEASYRSYLEGTPILTRGFTVGMRF